MDRIALTGGKPLSGVIPVSGAKNSALKLQAASLLTDAPLTLSNMPELADTRFMARLLEQLGVACYWPKQSGRLSLHAESLASTIAPYDLVRKMRATFNVLGPLLARAGHATVSLPGGCAIGARPVDLHLKAFEAMGADIHIEGGYVKAAALRGLKGARIGLPVRVGRRDGARLDGGHIARGETVLENAAREPEIADLAGCLTAMGARISGIGTSTLTNRGRRTVGGADWKVMPDRIEAGSYACAAAAAGGSVVLQGVAPDTLSALLDALKRAGVDIETGADHVRVSRPADRPLKAVDIDTQPYPGFPTDLQAQFMR